MLKGWFKLKMPIVKKVRNFVLVLNQKVLFYFFQSLLQKSVVSVGKFFLAKCVACSLEKSKGPSTKSLHRIKDNILIFNPM